jgi:hypothetical protein
MMKLKLKLKMNDVRDLGSPRENAKGQKENPKYAKSKTINLCEEFALSRDCLVSALSGTVPSAMPHA